MSETAKRVINKIITLGAKEGLGEPVGAVLIFRDEAFLKAVWNKDSNRDQNATALLNASLDELSKA